MGVEAIISRNGSNKFLVKSFGDKQYFLFLVSTSFFSVCENVYRYAHFFFFWLTSSYVEDSNKDCLMHVLCASTWLLGLHGGSGSYVQSSHPSHITAHHIHEYQAGIRWISLPLRPSVARASCQKK